MLGLLIAAVVWIISIFIITKISNLKEKNVSFLWKFIVLLLGPIGVAAYYFTLKKV